MKTIFLSLALLGLSLAQGQNFQLNGQIKGDIKLPQDQLNIGGGLLQNPIIGMMPPRVDGTIFFAQPQIKPNCPKACKGKVSKDLIINGGFEKNKCLHSYCQYSSSSYKK